MPFWLPLFGLPVRVGLALFDFFVVPFPELVVQPGEDVEGEWDSDQKTGVLEGKVLRDGFRGGDLVRQDSEDQNDRDDENVDQNRFPVFFHDTKNSL